MEQVQMNEREPGLYDIFHPVVVRWKWLLAGMIVAVLAAAAVTSLMQKEYETSFVLTIGLAADKQLEDTYTVVNIINSKSFQQSALKSIGMDASSDLVIESKTDPNRWNGNPTFVTVRAAAPQPQRAVQVAEAVSGAIIKRHTEIYEDKVRSLKAQRDDIDRSIERLNQHNNSLKQQLRIYNPKAPANTSTELLIEERLNNNENQIITLKKEWNDVQALLSTVQTRNTALVSSPVLPGAPTKPNLKLNLIVAGVGSFFLMISFILLLEQYRKGSIRF